MDHYKSWSGLKQYLEDSLCEALKGRITYFLTRYHEIRNCYGRAAIRLDGEELVTFSWKEGMNQEFEVISYFHENPEKSFVEIDEILKSDWDMRCTYGEMDFLDAVLQFRNLSIEDALKSTNYIIKILAILDKRVGRRTLIRMKEGKEHESFPEWVQQFYRIRLSLLSA